MKKKIHNAARRSSRTKCYFTTFKDGTKQAATEIHLMEDQIPYPFTDMKRSLLLSKPTDFYLYN